MIPTEHPSTPDAALQTMAEIISAMQGICDLARFDTVYSDPQQNMAYLFQLFVRPLDQAYGVLADAIRNDEDPEGGAA